MLTRRFTSTLRRARRREPVDRLTVTMAGNSCGVRPIAIASEKSNASMNGRCSTMLMTKIEAVSTPATRTRRNENPRSPTWKAVSAGRSPSPAAIRPKPVCMPVPTTTPFALPSRTIVPISAHEPEPCPPRRPSSHRERLAGEHGLVALELGGVEQADVGRDDVADREVHDVAGHQRGHVDALGCAVPHHERGVADLRVQRLDRLLGPELVHEAEADRERHDHADDHRVGGIAREPRDRGRGEEQQEQRVAELAREHRERPGAVAAQRVGAERAQALLGLGARETFGPRLERREHFGSRRTRREVEILEHRLRTLPGYLRRVDHATMRARFAAAEVGRLATVTAGALPHVVPCCFAVAGNVAYTAVDQKPKSTRRLQRLANLRANPQAALLVDHYDDDWRTLWWIRADGTGRVVDDAETERAIELLVAKYHQYRTARPGGPVIAIELTRWRAWP